MSHFDHPIYKENRGTNWLIKWSNDVYLLIGCFRAGPVLPLPPASEFPHPVRLEAGEDEPVFDASVHLDLSTPEYVVTFPHMRRQTRAPLVSPSTGSSFAWSGPFQLLSQEGLTVVRNIVKREEHRSLSTIKQLIDISDFSCQGSFII